MASNAIQPSRGFLQASANSSIFQQKEKSVPDSLVDQFGVQ
jgi:hypothetical protein